MRQPGNRGAAKVLPISLSISPFAVGVMARAPRHVTPVKSQEQDHNPSTEAAFAHVLEMDKHWANLASEAAVGM